MALTTRILNPPRRSNLIFVCVILSLHSGFDGAQAGDIYVSSNGENRIDCGRSIETPCETLAGALNTSNDGDTLWFDAHHINTTQFCLARAIDIRVSVSIRGFRGNPSIGCPNDAIGTTFLLSPEANTSLHLTFHSLTIVNSVILLQQSQLTNITFDSTHLIGSILRTTIFEFKIYPVVREIGLTILNNIWEGDANKKCGDNYCNPTSLIELWANYFVLHFDNSSFFQTFQHIAMADGAIDAQVKNCLFSNNDEKLPTHGGLHIRSYGLDLSRESNVHLQNCIFEKQVYDNPIASIMNIYYGTFQIHINSDGYHLSALVEQSIFRDNERGMAFIGQFKSLVIDNCTVERNIALHAGAGIELFAGRSNCSITNCVFDSNAAGALRNNLLSNSREYTVKNGEVSLHADCCKGIISLVGKGGAIRVQAGRLHLHSSVFRNNTARLLGSSLFVDKEGFIAIDNTDFENSDRGVLATQGDVLYSDGEVIIGSANVIIKSAQDHIAIIRHNGNHWSIEVKEIYLRCPVGYRLRATNTSAYGVQDLGLTTSHKMDQLSYFCVSCPRNKYSLDHGYLNYSLVYESFAHFTLLVNGTEPPRPFSGSMVHHDIDCLECPHGGRCEEGITAVPNFWGYTRDNTSIQFQHCPKGYCCSSTSCADYNMCAAHRTGTICGQCDEGYSEALFSPECVPNKLCNPTWLWPVALASGFLYAMFLLFQKDMRDHMVLSPDNIQDLRDGLLRICCTEKQASKSQDTNHILNHQVNSNHQVTEQSELEALQSDMDIEPDKPIVNNNQKPEGVSGTEGETKAEPPPDTGASFLIILFYYFQDAQLLHVKTVFATADTKSRYMVKMILSGLFKFRIELFQFMDKLCFIVGMSPSTKLLVKSVLVPWVLVQFGIMYVICKWLRCVNRLRESPPPAGQSDKKDDEEEKRTFLVKLSQGFVLSLLFTYQKLASTAFQLLKCVPVGDTSVLFIEGSIVCYEMWQYGIIAYTASCIVPFCLILLLGPGLMKDGLISLPQFFCACILPLPFLLYWVSLRLYLRGRKPVKNVELDAESKAVTAIMQGPFKETESKLFGPTCGQGVLIGRRLILVILHTFVNDPLIRMLAMMFICFIMLLHHVHVLPYKDAKGNIAGSASAAALLLVGGINLVRAGFEAAEYVPQGPNLQLMYVLDELENVLMLWFPAAVMSLVFLSLTIKIILYFNKRSALSPEPCNSTQVV